MSDSDIMEDIPKFGLYAIPNCKIYVEELTLTTNLGEYTKASMDFSINGLSLLAEEMTEADAHSYLPYDVMTNTDRWEPQYNMPTVLLAHESIVVDGVTKDAISMDGTNIQTAGDYQRFKIKTNLIGRIPVAISYKYRFENDYNPSWGGMIGAVEYASNQILGHSYSPSPNFIAGQEYSFEARVTPPTEITSADNPILKFSIYSGAKLYIYDLKLYSIGTDYKKASLSFTANGLDSVVQQGSVISQINQTAEQIKISAQKLDLTGDLDLHGIFTTDVSTTQGLEGYYAKLDAAALGFYDPDGGRVAMFTPVIPSSQYGSVPYLELTLYQDVTQGGDGVTISPYMSMFHKLAVNDEFTLEPNNSGTVAKFYQETRFYRNVMNSSGGVEFLSDRRRKRNIKDLAITKARSFIMALKPKKYKFIKDISTSDRYHHGFIAQEVHEAMPEDWGLYCENKKEDFIGLRYDEFLADLVAVVQDQQKRIEKLEKLIKSKEKETRK